MFAILERERALVRAKTQNEADMAMERAKSIVQSSFEHRDRQLQSLEMLTEGFVQRGYDLHDGKWRPSFGSFYSASAYVRQLAREMKRPYVKVTACPGRFSISVPNARRYDILVARLALLAGVNDDTCQVMRSSEATRMTFWVNCVGPWSVERAHMYQKRCKEHSDWWMHEAATNPAWRRALKLDT
jgi:hypothetical protein